MQHCFSTSIILSKKKKFLKFYIIALTYLFVADDVEYRLTYLQFVFSVLLGY